MNESQAIDRMRQVVRRQHKALATVDACDRVKFSLGEDLERFGRMAFLRAADCTGVIRRFHELRRRRPEAKVRSPKSRASEDTGEHPDYVLGSTLIEVPKYWSFDPKRNLKWI